MQPVLGLSMLSGELPAGRLFAVELFAGFPTGRFAGGQCLLAFLAFLLTLLELLFGLLQSMLSLSLRLNQGIELRAGGSQLLLLALLAFAGCVQLLTTLLNLLAAILQLLAKLLEFCFPLTDFSAQPDEIPIQDFESFLTGFEFPGGQPGARLRLEHS